MGPGVEKPVIADVYKLRLRRNINNEPVDLSVDGLVYEYATKTIETSKNVLTFMLLIDISFLDEN